MDITNITAYEMREKLLNKEISAVDITKEYLDKIKEDKDYLGAYITVNESAIESAKLIDDKIANGYKLGRLAGLPIGIKDNISVKDLKMTCGSKFLEDYIPPFDASLIEKIKAEDGIIIGKTNLDEFAVGSSTEASYFGYTKNPVDLTKVAGGSSGGSASAIGGNQGILSVGTDTGGSVRQPAAFCNVVGIKPSYGTISRYGVVSMANSMDQVGVFGKDVKDAAIILDVLIGYDGKDSTSYIGSDNILKDLDLDKDYSFDGMKIGIPKEFIETQCDELIRENFNKSIEILKKLGARVEEVDMPHIKYSNACYHVLSTSELSSNLARFDGIRYGHRADEYETLDDLYKNSRTEGLSFEVKRRIAMGTYILTGENREKYYLKALKVRRLIKEEFDKAFKEYDLLISPTTPNFPYNIGEQSTNTEYMYDGDKFTIPVNLAGGCGMSVPSGTANGLPMGLQFIGNMYDEAKLIKAGLAFEGGIINGL